MAADIPTACFVEHPRVINEARFDGKNQQPKQFHYFAIQGAGELPRLMLEASETPHDSIMYFGMGGYKDFAPFGQMPCYMGNELGGEVLAQSSSIARHVAREAGMVGNSAKERARHDMLWELAKDINAGLANVHNEGPIDGKYDAFMQGAVKMVKSSSGRFLVTDRLGLGDIGMFHALYTIEVANPGFLGKNYPELHTYTSLVAEVPCIARYLKSVRRLPITKNEIGRGNTGLGGFEYCTPLNPATLATVHK